MAGGPKNSFFLFHKTLVGPYIFSTSRAIFLSDVKVLWALMYTYRNQQRSSFHFHRLNQLLKVLKRIRRMELDYIEADETEQKTLLLKNILGEENALRKACIVAGLAIKKLLEMKLYLPFGLTAEGAIASIFNKIGPFIEELKKTLNVFTGQSGANLKVQAIKVETEKKVKKKEKKKNPTNTLTFVAPKSTLPSKRKPSSMEPNRDEIDDIFGD
jgi:hypothetical protein